MSATLTHIHIAPTEGADLRSLPSILATSGKGLEGDRNYGRTRQVTVVASGELAKAAAALGRGIAPGQTRRNLTVDIESIPRAHGTIITVGEVRLAVWRDCAPCELMNELIGDGAREALKRLAGVSATVVAGGTISVGDPVTIQPA